MQHSQSGFTSGGSDGSAHSSLRRPASRSDPSSPVPSNILLGLNQQQQQQQQHVRIPPTGTFRQKAIIRNAGVHSQPVSSAASSANIPIITGLPSVADSPGQNNNQQQQHHDKLSPYHTSSTAPSIHQGLSQQAGTINGTINSNNYTSGYTSGNGTHDTGSVYGHTESESGAAGMHDSICTSILPSEDIPVDIGRHDFQPQAIPVIPMQQEMISDDDPTSTGDFDVVTRNTTLPVEAAPNVFMSHQPMRDANLQYAYTYRQFLADSFLSSIPVLENIDNVSSIVYTQSGAHSNMGHDAVQGSDYNHSLTIPLSGGGTLAAGGGILAGGAHDASLDPTRDPGMNVQRAPGDGLSLGGVVGVGVGGGVPLSNTNTAAGGGVMNGGVGIASAAGPLEGMDERAHIPFNERVTWAGMNGSIVAVSSSMIKSSDDASGFRVLHGGVNNGLNKLKFENFKLLERRKATSYAEFLHPAGILEPDMKPLYDPRDLDFGVVPDSARIVIALPAYLGTVVKHTSERDANKLLESLFKRKAHSSLSMRMIHQLREDMIELGVECGMELSTVASAIVLMEKLVLRSKLTKQTKKMHASGCLALACKVNEMHAPDDIIEMCDKYFDIPPKEFKAAEWQTYVDCEFTVYVSRDEVQPHIDKLLDSKFGEKFKPANPLTDERNQRIIMGHHIGAGIHEVNMAGSAMTDSEMEDSDFASPVTTHSGKRSRLASEVSHHRLV